MKAKISVIIPAYNTGNYIENCLMSVIDRQMKTEIIVVDDGSMDNTQQIVESLEKRYGNITFLQQEHKGPSSCVFRSIPVQKSGDVFSIQKC